MIGKIQSGKCNIIYFRHFFFFGMGVPAFKVVFLFCFVLFLFCLFVCLFVFLIFNSYFKFWIEVINISSRHSNSNFAHHNFSYPLITLQGVNWKFTYNHRAITHANYRETIHHKLILLAKLVRWAKVESTTNIHSFQFKI